MAKRKSSTDPFAVKRAAYLEQLRLSQKHFGDNWAAFVQAFAQHEQAGSDETYVTLRNLVLAALVVATSHKTRPDDHLVLANDRTVWDGAGWIQDWQAGMRFPGPAASILAEHEAARATRLTGVECFVVSAIHQQTRKGAWRIVSVFRIQKTKEATEPWSDDIYVALLDLLVPYAKKLMEEDRLKRGGQNDPND